MKIKFCLLRFKAVFSDKLTCIIMISSVLLFLFLINSLSFHADKRSSIPIGLVNLDRSESARELADNIKKVPGLYVYEGQEKELKELLLKEEIRACFLINDGYEKAVRAGKTDGLISMYYLEGDESAKILSDIIAGEMLYKICLYKGFRLYASLPGTASGGRNASGGYEVSDRLSEQEYKAYVNSLITGSDFDFAFDIRMVQISDPDRESTIPNSVLYLEAVWGIGAMLLSFTAMLMNAGGVFEKEFGIRKRLRIALVKPLELDLSQFAASFAFQSIPALLLCLSLYRQIPDFTAIDALEIFLLSDLFSVVMILWFLVLGKLAGSTGKYQFMGIISILTFGLLGFMPLITGFLDNDILNISKIIPNCWFIKEFTDIILNTNLKDISYNSYLEFMIAACCLLVINILINKWQCS